MGLIQEKLLASCRRCELRIGSDPNNRAALAQMLQVHETYCPGGDRSGELWMPFAVMESPPADREILSRS